MKYLKKSFFGCFIKCEKEIAMKQSFWEKKTRLLAFLVSWFFFLPEPGGMNRREGEKMHFLQDFSDFFYFFSPPPLAAWLKMHLFRIFLPPPPPPLPTLILLCSKMRVSLAWRWFYSKAAVAACSPKTFTISWIINHLSRFKDQSCA